MTPGPEPCQGPEVTTPRIEPPMVNTQQRVPNQRLFSVTLPLCDSPNFKGRSQYMFQFTYPPTRRVAAPTRSVAPVVVETTTAVAP